MSLRLNILDLGRKAIARYKGQSLKPISAGRNKLLLTKEQHLGFEAAA